MKVFVSYYKLDIPAYIFNQESSKYWQITDNIKCILDDMWHRMFWSARKTNQDYQTETAVPSLHLMSLHCLLHSSGTQRSMQMAYGTGQVAHSSKQH